MLVLPWLQKHLREVGFVYDRFETLLKIVFEDKFKINLANFVLLILKVVLNTTYFLKFE